MRGYTCRNFSDYFTWKSFCKSSSERPMSRSALCLDSTFTCPRCYEYAGALGQTAEEPAIEIRRPGGEHRDCCNGLVVVASLARRALGVKRFRCKFSRICRACVSKALLATQNSHRILTLPLVLGWGLFGPLAFPEKGRKGNLTSMFAH